MKIRRSIYALGVLPVLALFLAAPPMRAQSQDSTKINNLFADARSYAVQAEHHADTLKAYTRSGLKWEAHATQLNSMKEHVNDLGKVAKNLNDARSEGSPWQQTAIDRINPLLQDMAAQLTTTINHLNDNQSKIHTGSYREYTDANYDLASRTASMISDVVEYGKAKSKSESLEHKLELPASGAGLQ